MVICQHCGKPSRNPKFCSRRCANTVNGHLYPSRARTARFCKKCGVDVTGRRTVCDLCNPSYVDWRTVTLRDLRARAAQQYAAQVRQQARLTYQRAGQPAACALCNYAKHVEICPIRPINSFPPETSVAEVNQSANLVALCPNHHWEFDKGLIALN